jgi:hypothetical protein
MDNKEDIKDFGIGCLAMILGIVVMVYILNRMVDILYHALK